MKMKKITILQAGSTGFEFFATLSNGETVTQKISGRPYAYDHLVRDIAAITGQTARGVKASLRKWIVV